MSIKGGTFKKETFNIDTCNVTFPIPYFYASTKEVNTVLEAISVWPLVQYIFQIPVNTGVPFRIYSYFIYIYIYIYIPKKRRRRRRRRSGKMVNDIVSTTRIMSTKLTFRATLPFQILSMCRKKRKKSNTFFILVFSSLVPYLFYSFIYFFLLLHA